MQSMDAATREEFATLRRRAYGPDADIDDDPAALARLRELESREDRSLSPAQAARAEEAERLFGPRPLRSEVAVPSVPSASETVVVPVESPLVEMAARLARTPPPIGRGLLIGWAASIVLVAIVVGALVFGLASLRPVSPVTGARQVASLDQPVTDLEVGDAMTFLHQAAGLYRYSGLVVAVFDRGVMDPDQICLLVGSEASVAGDGELRFATGCTAGSFFPTANILVKTNSPDELTAAFPVGTSLQFVWDGTAVGVFAADPPPPTNAPA